MDKLSLVESIAQSLRDSIQAKLVFGEPIHKDGITIIPVAYFRYGFGAGYGRKAVEESEGQGGGGGVLAKPIG